MDKQLRRLKTEVKIKLSILELAMISIALADYAVKISCDDKDGEALLRAYKRLHKRLSKECKP